MKQDKLNLDNSEQNSEKNTLISSKLIKHCSELCTLWENMEKLGMFPGYRDLLTCPKCGLMEDVTAEGLFLVYNNLEPNTKITQDKDTGLRFEELNGETQLFKCPNCGTKFIAVSEVGEE